MELAKIFNNQEPGKIYGLIGNYDFMTNTSNFSIVLEYRFKGQVKEYLKNPKMEQALKMVMLDSTYLDKTIDDLSPTELKIISLAKALIENKKYIYLDYFEKGLNYKEKENYKRLFKKISKDYHKTIIIHTNDLKFLWDICDEIINVDNNKITNISKADYFNIDNDVDIPEIVEITKLLKEKNIKIENYKNPLDLLKAIYRIKGD